LEAELARVLEEVAEPVDRTKSEPRNRLLAALRSEDLLSLRAYLQRVLLAEGSLLFEANEPITRVYFVEAGVVSLMAAFHNGGTAEMATVGWEGVVGVGTSVTHFCAAAARPSGRHT
jgi:CRP-like cAMP-binding protein